jgi:hypothetical protein
VAVHLIKKHLFRGANVDNRLMLPHPIQQFREQFAHGIYGGSQYDDVRYGNTLSERHILVDQPPTDGLVQIFPTRIYANDPRSEAVLLQGDAEGAAD